MSFSPRPTSFEEDIRSWWREKRPKNKVEWFWLIIWIGVYFEIAYLIYDIKTADLILFLRPIRPFLLTVLQLIELYRSMITFRGVFFFMGINPYTNKFGEFLIFVTDPFYRWGEYKYPTFYRIQIHAIINFLLLDIGVRTLKFLVNPKAVAKGILNGEYCLTLGGTITRMLDHNAQQFKYLPKKIYHDNIINLPGWPEELIPFKDINYIHENSIDKIYNLKNINDILNSINIDSFIHLNHVPNLMV